MLVCVCDLSAHSTRAKWKQCSLETGVHLLTLSASPHPGSAEPHWPACLSPPQASSSELRACLASWWPKMATSPAPSRSLLSLAILTAFCLIPASSICPPLHLWRCVHLSPWGCPQLSPAIPVCFCKNDGLFPTPVRVETALSSGVDMHREPPGGRHGRHPIAALA